MNKFQVGDEVEYCGDGSYRPGFPWRRGTHRVIDVSRMSGAIQLNLGGTLRPYLKSRIFRKVNSIQENE